MKNSIYAIIALLLFSISCKKDQLDSLKPDFSVESSQVMAGGKVIFKDLSEGQPSTWRWQFEGGLPATSDLSGPEVVYNKPGTYAVTLEIKNNATSAIETKSGFITVSYNDVATDFTASKVSVIQDESVTFTDKSLGLPNKWAWEFKSATTVLTSAEQNPVVKFTVPGVYSVSLTSSNPKGESTASKPNMIAVIDVTSVEANFESDQRATYTGGSIKFTDKSIGTATHWSWTFEGASTVSSDLQNPTVVYPAPGRFKVKLVASNTVKNSIIEKVGYIMVVPGGSLTAFYPFNGSFDDLGPSKLTSRGEGVITFSGADRTLTSGHAATFNGSGGFEVPDNDAMNFGTGDYSVSCWMKTAANTRGMIWQESGAKAGGDNQTWLRIIGTATNLTSFATEDAGGGSTINLTVALDGSIVKTNDDKWHNIVCVRQGPTTTIYIDGAKIRSVTASATKNTSNNGTFKVGMQENATGYLNKYDGQIDDLLIYKKALTQAEITLLNGL